MRHRSDNRCTLAFHGPLLHRGDVVSYIRCRNDFSAAVGHHLYGRRFLFYEVCANRDVCIHRDFGGWLLLRMAEACIRMGLKMSNVECPMSNVQVNFEYRTLDIGLWTFDNELWLNTIRDSS